MSSNRRGPPKHQNRFAWKPNAGCKINETEVGGKFRPLSEITGVCPRCKEQIDWKRRYGKYKPLSEPAKCQRCSKRAVRQAYHNLCTGCAKEQNVCAKCCCRVDRLVGRDIAEVEAEQKMLEQAIKNSRERDRRSLLRAMNKDKSNNSMKTPGSPTNRGEKVGEIFPDASLEDYASKNKGVKDSNGVNSIIVDGMGDEEDEDNEEAGDHDIEEEDEDNIEDKALVTKSDTTWF